MLELARTGGVPIYGLNLRDDRVERAPVAVDARRSVPASGFDPNGEVAVDWGVYGAPETFLIGRDGTVLYKHISAADARGMAAGLLAADRAGVRQLAVPVGEGPRIEPVTVRLAIVLGALLLGAAAHAIDTEQAFDDPALEARYRTLIHEIRCPKCQNESIADSEAPVAADLRREVRRLLADGKSDADVRSYLLARYGDFVLYKPRMSPATWALWGGPGAFLLVGAFVFWRVLRVRQAQPIEEDEPT